LLAAPLHGVDCQAKPGGLTPKLELALANQPNPKSSGPVQTESPIEISQSLPGPDPPVPLSGIDTVTEESVMAASTGDLPTYNDNLGFEPYVQAIAEFLLNPSTHGPLTVSVEGEWGSGKSSFMLQLQERLTSIPGAQGQSRQLRTPLSIWFNAWRHDKDEALWAAFASEFTSRIAEEQGLPRRMWGHLVLLWRRFNWHEGWLDLLRAIVLWTTIFVLASILISVAWLKGASALADYASKLSKPDALNAQTWSSLRSALKGAGWAGGALAYLTLLLAGVVKLKQYVGNPLAIDLRRYIQEPDYASRISFVENFHKDFSRIVDAYAGDKTVYVFIDDLDRCEVPKAAELMQALNLMMSTDRRGLIFIIGMDRAKVAAGLAVKNEKLLPYLYASSMGPIGDVNHINPLLGLVFGYNFIEKFIQIPFLVPSPAPGNVQQFFDKLANPEINRKGSHLERSRNGILGWIVGQRQLLLRNLSARQSKIELSGRADMASQDQGTSSNSIAKSAPAVAARREKLKLAVTGDSATVRGVVLSIAPVLGNNPRRMKQFVNLFRLRTFIAAETGLFDGDDGLTLKQLGKFVALNLRWPLLLADLERDPRMLDSLTKVAVGASVPDKISGAVTRWMSDPILLELLKSRMTIDGDSTPSSVEGAAEITGPWSLCGIDMGKLMRVSPRMHTIPLNQVAGVVPKPLPRSHAENSYAGPHVEEASSSANDARSRQEPDISQSSSGKQQRIVTLVAEAADFDEAQRLQGELASQGIVAKVMQGHLSGSNLAVKLEQNREDETVFYCLGVSIFQLGIDPTYITLAVGDERIPIIMRSIEGGELNQMFHDRIYFDIRESGGFEKLVRYVHTGTLEDANPPNDIERVAAQA